MSEQLTMPGFEDAATPAPELTPVQQIVVRSHIRQRRISTERKKAKMAKRPRLTWEQRFQKFHEANPHVYCGLVNLARELKRKGVPKYGMAALYEVLRYRSITTQETTPGSGYKLNNSYRAYYARLIEKNEPDLAGFFKMRETRS
jgi:hypothetical protein